MQEEFRALELRDRNEVSVVVCVDASGPRGQLCSVDSVPLGCRPVALVVELSCT
jgi:hypothetical protein